MSSNRHYKRITDKTHMLVTQPTWVPFGVLSINAWYTYPHAKRFSSEQDYSIWPLKVIALRTVMRDDDDLGNLRASLTSNDVSHGPLCVVAVV